MQNFLSRKVLISYTEFALKCRQSVIFSVIHLALSNSPEEQWSRGSNLDLTHVQDRNSDMLRIQEWILILRFCFWHWKMHWFGILWHHPFRKLHRNVVKILPSLEYLYFIVVGIVDSQPCGRMFESQARWNLVWWG